MKSGQRPEKDNDNLFALIQDSVFKYEIRPEQNSDGHTLR